MGGKQQFLFIILILLVSILINAQLQCPAGTYFDGNECIYSDEPKENTIFAMPLYIANPKTLECKYYFTGDFRHFNPRPENFTIDIGPTTDYSSEQHACDVYKCYLTNGMIVVTDGKPVEEDLCKCPAYTTWSNNTGCQPEKPIYVANLEKKDCVEYSAEDIFEFKPRLEKYNYYIGYKDNFKDIGQACDVFKCDITNGTVNIINGMLQEKLCICPEKKKWESGVGCVSDLSFFERVWSWLKGLFTR